MANFPVAYCGLKIITSLSLRFPDFQRLKPMLELSACYPH
ncbi:Serine/threonine protein kinase [methanotrophic endosymbiont of Bathymodiolus azoricus (Menez Gwen)]|nr:Serine/threonine protein kinase [methanotrophic endosymbiont of Bathymodiolus azoricus (Menez Gwen)]